VQYMVVMGIKGSNDQGLSSVPWTNQKPPSLDSFFAGTSNFFFTFGACAGLSHITVGACGTPHPTPPSHYNER